MSILKLQEKLSNREITSQELFNKALSQAYEYNKEYKLFETIIKEKEEIKSNSKIAGIPYTIKDNYSTKAIKTTASSNILKNYIPPYDATVYKKLKEAGAVLIAKASLDELAMGGTGTTGHLGAVLNPWDKTRIMGGSSAGSAASVALGIVPFSIGSDTGDSIRKPAAYGGLVGFKPTYGRISRYGLFAFASSLDHVGTFTNNVEDAAILTDILKGEDQLDMTTLKDDKKSYFKNLDNDIKGKKLFYFKDLFEKDYYKDDITEELSLILDNFKDTISKVKKLGIKVEEVSFPIDLLKAIYPSYMIISCAEATSNNANLTGISFGERGSGKKIDEIIFSARTKGFSELIKRRFILGSYILQKENQEKLYLNATRVRRLITDKMNDLFKEYDGLILPATGSIAPKFDEGIDDKLSEKYLVLENHLAIGNFGGYPSITIPSGIVNKMPIAINITSPQFKDSDLLNIAKKIESKLAFKDLLCKEDCDV